jgi:NAD(P)-dependent dehydrogenase (short-subunit alcohol dehydrogenase family)
MLAAMGRQEIRSAVVTGAGGGIGRQLCLALAERGAKVLAADIDLVAARRTAAEIEVRSLNRGKALAAECDVRSVDAVERLAEIADESFDGVDLLVNNAGILVLGELATTSLSDYKRVLDVNLWGVIHGCHVFVPRMKQRGSGRILNVASLAGVMPLPYMGAYSATKAAVISLSETMRAELAGSNISVTVLCPSFTQTRLIDDATGAGAEAPRPLANRVMDFLGADPARIARRALAAVDRGDLYEVPVLHGRLVWGAKRLAPRAVGLMSSLAYRFIAARS